MIVYRRSLSSGISFLFTSEISWDFAPFRCLPLDDGIAEVMSGQPVFGSFDNLIQRLCIGRTLQFCLAFALVNPENGIVGITIDGLIEKTLIPTESQGMDNGQELTDIICSLHGTKVKHACTSLKINALVFHGSRITTTAGIHRPCICLHLKWQGKHVR